MRQIACDIRDLKWDDASLILAGRSQMTRHNPYELWIYVPTEYSIKKASAGVLAVETEQVGQILKVRFQVAENMEQAWQVEFMKGFSKRAVPK